MTAYLALVLAAFAIFIVALAFTWIWSSRT